MWFASITISKFSCLFLSLKQYAYILNSSYWIILTLSLLACFAFLLWLLSFLFSYSSYLFLHICFLILISTSSDISSYSPFISSSWFLLNCGVLVLAYTHSANLRIFPELLLTLSWPRLHLSSYFLFFLSALSILFSLLAVSN